MSIETLPAEKTMPVEVKIDEHVSLRLLGESDAERFFDILENDPDIRTRAAWLAALTTLEETKSSLSTPAAGFWRYGIVEDGILNGYTGAWNDPAAASKSEYTIGYCCAKDARGRGLVTRAVDGLIDALKENVDADCFCLYIRDENVGSAAVAQRLGFMRTEQTALTRSGITLRRHEKR